MENKDIDNLLTFIKRVYQAHTTLREEQTYIHDRLYNNNSDYARNTKSYITRIEPNKNQ